MADTGTGISKSLVDLEMNNITSFASHFNPVSDEFQTAVDSFKRQDLATKVIIIGLTALAALCTFFVLGLGAIPAFRWAVNVFGSKSTNQRVHPEFFQELRMEREDAKQKADLMVNRLPLTQIEDLDRRRLLDQEFEQGREWTRDDLTNGSQLQQLYDLMQTPFWNPDNFNAQMFIHRFNMGYGPSSVDMIEYIQRANLKRLRAMSAYFVCQENGLAQVDLDDYNTLSECSLTLVGLVNRDILNAWLARAQELISV